MSRPTYAILPEDFARWPMIVTKINGRVACTARRCGVTLMLTRDLVGRDEIHGWWTVTKWHKGQEIYTKVVRNLPHGAARAIERERRRQAHECRLYTQGNLGATATVQPGGSPA